MIHILGILLFTGSLGASYGVQQTAREKQARERDVALEDTRTPVEYAGEGTFLVPIEAAAEVGEEDDLDHHLRIAGVGAGIAIAGHLLYAPLGLLSLPFLGYSTLMVFENAYQGLRAHKPRISMLDSIAICVGIGTGYFTLSAFANVLYIASLKMLNQTRNKTQQRISDIFSGHPPTVWLLKDGVEISVPLEKVQKGDRIVVNTGETVPIDGIIEQGMAGIDQHMLTGEAQPEEKTVGQRVLATTLVVSGRITVRVEKTGADTVAAHITEVLEKTDDYISDLKTRGERFANASVLPTIGLSGVALLAAGPVAMIVTLSSNFSEVMRFSVPLTMLNYLRIASHKGLLIKDGRSLEQLPKVDTVVFDKTGTLTLEQPHVGKIYSGEGFSEREVLYYTAAAEYRQTHPIAKAVLDAAAQQGVVLPSIDDAQYSIGYGIGVSLEGRSVRVGSARFMQREHIPLPEIFEMLEQQAHEQGYSLIYTALDGVLCGVVELHPTLRPEAREVVRALRRRGLKVYILSGDHAGPVKNLATQLGVDEYIAETLPEDKSRVIEELQQGGKAVCFVGDGINDSIALKRAAVSVSLQDASHVAIDSAQVVLMNKNLRQLLSAFELAERFKFNQYLAIDIGTVAPSLICMGGAIFLGLTVAGTLWFYCLSMAMGVGSAMLPLLEARRSSPSPA